MKKKVIMMFALMVVGGLTACVAVAQTRPVVNIGLRHSNMRSAQQNIVAAYAEVERAQNANEDQLGGHAQRAKELLSEADQELRMATGTANAEGR